MTLLDDYRRHAADYGLHIISGDADATNRSYDQVQHAFHSIVRAGDSGQLFTLYDDDDSSVQCWAAAHTLEIDQSRALVKLAQLQQAGIPHISTDAKYIIEEWRNGNLHFHPEHPREA